MRIDGLPAKFAPEHVTAIIDSREQLPYDLAPMRAKAGTLAAGDYSIDALEDYIAIERKSLTDFLACCGVERERFTREIQRLRSYETRAIIVEAGWDDLERGDWRSSIRPEAVLASVYSWIGIGIPIILAGTRERGQAIVARILFYAARRRYYEARTLACGVLNRIEAEAAT
jgi:ERCC4-type nuclease